MVKRVDVLVVDDNLSLLQATALILKGRGYTVATARDGLEAIQEVAAQPFDMILMDVRMPRMDGTEACRRILQMRPEAVVVIVTAYAYEALVQQMLGEGALRVLQKPVDVEELIAIVEENV